MKIQEIAQQILLNPIFELLKFLYTTTGNFGIAIIVMTIFIRTVLIPFTLPTIRSQKKMRELKPQIDALKKKHAKDQKALQLAQMNLFKEHNVNPISGCLPYIVQIIVIFALYNVLNGFVAKASDMGLVINTQFLGLDLSRPDPRYIIPILAAATQLVHSLMLLPGAEKHDIYPEHSKKKNIIEANKKESSAQDMAESMQKQMVFMMPLMSGLFALNFPSGLGLYWIVTSIFSVAQQWIISGPGGLADLIQKIQTRVLK